MKKLINLNKWEFNYLDIVDPKDNGQYYYYFKFFLSSLLKGVEGDAIEAGVFRGKSLISAALILKKLRKNKRIWGYDTFSGFTLKQHKNDKFEKFKKLYKDKKISKLHFHETLKLKKHHKFVKFNKKPSIFNLSTSNDFSKTSYAFVKKKIDYFDCKKNIKLIQGTFKETFIKKRNLPKKIFCGLIDCDLHDGYQDCLNTFFPILIRNGKLFLDEYYSLKFPGPRIAVDDFLLKNKNAFLIKEGISNGFERWSIQKK